VRAANRIAVGDDGSADARAGLSTAVAALNANPVRAFFMRTDPNAGDCAGKPYAAYVTLTSTRFALIEGTDLDIGVKLSDCGGWQVRSGTITRYPRSRRRRMPRNSPRKALSACTSGRKTTLTVGPIC